MAAEGLGGIRLVLGPKIDPPGAENIPNKASLGPSVHTNGPGAVALGITFGDSGRLGSRNCAVVLTAAHVWTRVDQGSSRRGCFFAGGAR